MKSYSNILCPYQQSIRLCVSDTWRLNKNMMVQMPTGIGKRKEEGLVCSSQWLSHHWEDVENDRSDLIVIDEAHRALAETYKELWAHYPDAKN